MTSREFLSAVVSANINDEMTSYATDAIAKLDARNAKRSSKPSKTAVANEPIKAMIADFLSANGTHSASEIGVGTEISTAKASALLRQMVADGKVTVETVKVPKKGEVRVYTLA